MITHGDITMLWTVLSCVCMSGSVYDICAMFIVEFVVMQMRRGKARNVAWTQTIL